MNVNCPQCGGEVKFRSSSEIFAVCPYCRASIFRTDKGIENLGIMAEVPFDVSPLCVGTGGMYQTKAFTVEGRLILQYEDGYWNEWYAPFSNQEAWIGEAQGLFMLTTRKPDLESLVNNNPNNYSLKQMIDLTGLGKYTVIDLKEVSCLSAEGSLPFSSAPGVTSHSIDLTDGNGGFATIELTEGETPRVFAGNYVDFDEFHFKGLREIQGWKFSPSPRGK